MSIFNRGRFGRSGFGKGFGGNGFNRNSFNRNGYGNRNGSNWNGFGGWTKFMNGRRGPDQLTLALIILTLVMRVISSFSHNLWPLAILSAVPFIYAIYRFFSKNVEKRRMENQKFNIFMAPFYSWFRSMMRRYQDRDTHRYYKCPNCKSTLRVPKGKGKISIHCPKCKLDFIRKS